MATEAAWQSLRTFFSDDKNWQLFNEVRNAKNRGSVSLRTLDYLVTKYAPRHDVRYVLLDSSGTPYEFILSSAYKAQLSSFHKERFDPFCRTSASSPKLSAPKVEFRGVHTAYKQLNFFRWAISHHVVRYATEHFDEIDAEMNPRTKRKRNTTALKIFKSTNDVGSSAGGDSQVYDNYDAATSDTLTPSTKKTRVTNATTTTTTTTTQPTPVSSS